MTKGIRGGAHDWVIGGPEHTAWRKRISAAHKRRHIKCANHPTCRNLCKKGTADGLCSQCRALTGPAAYASCTQCGRRSRKGICGDCKGAVNKRARDLARHAFRPKPIIFVLNGETTFRYGKGIEPDTHREIHVMSRPFYERVFHAKLMMEPVSFRERAQVEMLPSLAGSTFHYQCAPSPMVVTLDGSEFIPLAQKRLEIRVKTIGLKPEVPPPLRSILRSRA